MADANKSQTSWFTKQKAYWESLKRVEKDLLQYMRDGIHINKSCYILDIPRSTVYNWLDIAKYNPDAPDELKKFFKDFREAKVEGRKKRIAIKYVGKEKTELDNKDNIIKKERIVDYGKLSKEFQSEADLYEQDDKEEHSHNPDFDDFQNQLKE